MSDAGSMYDAVVVGGGPAGLAAASWLGRFRKTTLVLDSAEYRNRWVEKAHGYLGSDPLNPAEFLERARSQLASYPNVEMVHGTVDSIDGAAGGFSVATPKVTYRARRIILATGTSDVFPRVKGFFDHYGSEVFHCPVCDGYEAKGRRVAVLGWNEQVTGFAIKLLNWAAEVTVVAQGTKIDSDDRVKAQLASRGIRLCEQDAIELLGPRGALAGVVLQGGGILDCDYLFFSLPERPVNRLAEGLGCEMADEGHVVIDREGRTSVDGVYAAGDLTPGEQLIQIAAAEGTLAALDCIESLNEP